MSTNNKSDCKLASVKTTDLSNRPLLMRIIKLSTVEQQTCQRAPQILKSVYSSDDMSFCTMSTFTLDTFSTFCCTSVFLTSWCCVFPDDDDLTVLTHISWSYKLLAGSSTDSLICHGCSLCCQWLNVSGAVKSAGGADVCVTGTAGRTTRQVTWVQLKQQEENTISQTLQPQIVWEVLEEVPLVLRMVP